MADGRALYTLLNEIYLILDDGDRRLFSRFYLKRRLRQRLDEATII